MGFMSDGLSVRDVSKKHPLHWPAWIWVVGGLIAGGVLIVGTIVEISHGIEGDPDVIWLDVFKAFGLRCFNILILIASAVTMLIKRKIGWIFALVTLAFTLVYRSVSWIWWLFRGEIEAETTGQLLLLLIVVVLTFGIPIAWLIYFIRARKGYWPSKSNPVISPNL